MAGLAPDFRVPPSATVSVDSSLGSVMAALPPDKLRYRTGPGRTLGADEPSLVPHCGVKFCALLRQDARDAARDANGPLLPPLCMR